MKHLLKKVLPNSALRALRRVKWAADDRRNANRSSKEVFSEIYDKNKWGGGDVASTSGAGSAVAAVTEPYLELIRSHLIEGENHLTVVDLGCGDMTVGRQLLDHCGKFVGVDVVPSLIEQHRAASYAAHAEFHALDLTKDDLPAGDVALVRQVLQHLSNDQIGRVLPKLKQYPIVFVTEHYPGPSRPLIPNLDMVQGTRIRACVDSAVCLDEPPFSVLREQLEKVLEVAGAGLDETYDPGVIRTFKWTPR